MTAQMNVDVLEERTLQAFTKRARFPKRAVRALLHAQRLLGLAFGLEIAERRSEDEPLQRAFGQAKLNEILLRAFQEVVAILGEHLDKVHESSRPHYTPELRYRILRVRNLLGFSQSEIARLFRVAPTTIARWEIEARGSPDKTTVGCLVRPSPPVRRFADVVRSLVQSMAASGFGGNQRIAETLARAGWKLSRESVRRMRREKPTTAPETTDGRFSERSLRARHPNHLWMIDITEIPSWFRIFTFRLALVLDVFSRFPLAWKVFWLEPSAKDIRCLISTAIRRHGSPRYLVSDQGRQFTARLLGRWLRAQGIQQRFGAIGKTGSIAIIERFWKTIKDLLGLPLAPPFLRSELERRLDATVTYYAELKPHHGLGGDTPADRYFEREPASQSLRSPPRARPAEKSSPLPLRVAYFRRNRRLPCLVPRAA